MALTRFRSLFVLGLLPVMLSAQDPRNGPKVGITMATISYGGFLSWQGLPKFGPMGGWSFELPVTYQMSVLLEPMYMSKGSIAQNAALKTQVTTSTSYIEMPLLGKLSTSTDPQGLFLTAGFVYGRFMEGKQRQYLDGELVREYEFEPQYKSDWSAALGIGMEKGNWMWEVRGQNSFRLGGVITSNNVVFSGQICWRFPPRKPKEKKEEEEEPTE
jgi:hypothetical protein